MRKDVLDIGSRFGKGILHNEDAIERRAWRVYARNDEEDSKREGVPSHWCGSLTYMRSEYAGEWP